MGKYNIFTGADKTSPDYKPVIKQMCLNCKSCFVDNDSYFCNNDNVLESGKKKILESVPEGFEISMLELKPMALRNPTKKCKNYDTDIESIKALILEELV